MVRCGRGGDGDLPGLDSGWRGVAGDRCVPSTPEKSRSPKGGLASEPLDAAMRGVVSLLVLLFSASPFVAFFWGILSVKVNPR